ncbi:MAG: glutamate--tRNA ligase [Candidatus Asgardarchaeia archaeon]
MSDLDELRKIVLKYVLLNAIQYGGKADTKAVMGKVMSEKPELRTQVKLVLKVVNEEVSKVNQMSLSQQKSLLDELGVEVTKRKEEKKRPKLPPLPNVAKYAKVVMRLAPYPSGPLHIGNARMVILNDEYIKLYNGELILAYDDTIGSKEKKILPEAYDLIREGLEWLGVKWHKTIYKSDRVPVFYEYGKKLIELGQAYVCTCPAEVFREKYKKLMKECPHRNASIEENLEHWDKMLDGTYGEGEAVVRLKTDMANPNPALRDPPILRISEREHPRVGSKYRVWPLLEFNWAIDDHLLGITHILRGKDLIKEDIIEKLVWRIFNWPEVEFIHYGQIMFKGLSLSKSKSRKLIEAGVYVGWSDPRTWSLQSLDARGIKPESLRTVLLELGLSLTDIEFSPEILYSYNRKLIDKEAKRLFFVASPIKLTINKIPFPELISRPLWHPDFPDQGNRIIHLFVNNGTANVYISKNDYEKLELGSIVRLKELMNIIITSKADHEAVADFHSKSITDLKGIKAPVIHWVPTDSDLIVLTEVLMPNGTIEKGFAEHNLKQISVGDVVQFERFGFVKIHEINKTRAFAYYGHP